MMNSNSIIPFILVAFVICGCQTKTAVLPTKNLSPGDEALMHLNAWAEDALECPADHPGFLVGGETNAMVDWYKKQLYDLGLPPRWDCQKNLYEIVPSGQSLSPICGCKSNGTPSPLLTLSPLPLQTPLLSEMALGNLNNWYPELLNMIECRVEYANNPHASGHETTATHIEISKKQASELGLQVRWNCQKSAYELVPSGENSSPICGCVIPVFHPSATFRAP